MTNIASTDLVLSSTAAQAGGALVRILGDSTEIERFSYGNLKPASRWAIMELVDENRQLNSEKNIGVLIWLATFHDVAIGKWAIELVETYPLADISATFDYLYDNGARVDARSTYVSENENTAEDVIIILDLLQLHKELEGEFEIRSAEQIDGLIDLIGSIRAAGDINSVEELKEIMFDKRSERE